MATTETVVMMEEIAVGGAEPAAHGGIYNSIPLVKYGSYGAFQRYLCKDCDRTFNDKTGTIFAHSKVALRKWLVASQSGLEFASGTLN